MMESEENEVERLMDLREDLRRRRDELREELSQLDLILEVVESQLRDESFSTADKLVTTEDETPSAKDIEEPEAEERAFTLLTIEGKDAVEVTVGADTAKIIVDEDFAVPVDSRPVGYLVKNLDRYSEEDLEAIQRGELSRDEKMEYKVKEDSGQLRSLTLENYRHEERLRDITGKARWAVKTVIDEQRTQE